MGIGKGDTAPDFTLPDKDGRPVNLRQLLSRGPVVLFFYPKDETQGCTVEACSFRDAYEDFKAEGVEVVGISSDSEASHQSFAKNHRLPFILLSDRGGEVRKRYGIKPSFLGLVAGRATFVITSDGTVRHMFESQVNVRKHVVEALGSLKEARVESTA